MSSSTDTAGMMTGLRLAVDSAPFPCAVIDQKGGIVLANGRIRAATGAHRSIGAFLCGTDAEMRASLECLFGSSAVTALRLCLPGGHDMLWHGFRLTALPAGVPPLAMVQAHDASARAQSVRRDATLAALAASRANERQLRAEAERLRRLSLSDHLTGLLNARAFRARAEQALRAATARAPVALVYADLNGFKAVNDRLGHRTGDAVLRVVATALAAQCRAGDYAGRLGGDEFALCLTATGGARVADRLDDLRWEIAEKLLHAPSLRQAGRCGWISTSLGAAIGPTDAAGYDALLDLAEQRMYSEKPAIRRRARSVGLAIPQPSS